MTLVAAGVSREGLCVENRKQWQNYAALACWGFILNVIIVREYSSNIYNADFLRIPLSVAAPVVMSRRPKRAHAAEYHTLNTRRHADPPVFQERSRQEVREVE